MSNRARNLIQIKRHSLPKYTVLRQYLHLLEHYPFEGVRAYCLIDAFAGTGEIFRTWDRKVISGSSLLMVEFAKKGCNLPAKCISVEANFLRFGQLENALSQYPPVSECLCGDCNSEVINIFNILSDDDFAFVFFDPDGLGSPPLQYATVKRALAHKNVEILLNFQWRAGLLRVLSKKTPGVMATITNFIGTATWKGIMRKRLPPEQKMRQLLKLYLRDFEKRFSNIQSLEIPPNSKIPQYFLVFATDRAHVADEIKRAMDDVRVQFYRRKRAILA